MGPSGSLRNTQRAPMMRRRRTRCVALSGAGAGGAGVPRVASPCRTADAQASGAPASRVAVRAARAARSAACAAVAGHIGLKVYHCSGASEIMASRAAAIACRGRRDVGLGGAADLDGFVHHRLIVAIGAASRQHRQHDGAGAGGKRGRDRRAAWSSRRRASPARHRGDSPSPPPCPGWPGWRMTRKISRKRRQGMMVTPQRAREALSSSKSSGNAESSARP